MTKSKRVHKPDHRRGSAEPRPSRSLQVPLRRWMLELAQCKLEYLLGIEASKFREVQRIEDELKTRNEEIQRRIKYALDNIRQ
jgi:hypothetical protein